MPAATITVAANARLPWPANKRIGAANLIRLRTGGIGLDLHFRLMAVWPKFLYLFGLSLSSNATARKLRRPQNDAGAQAQALASLTHSLGATAFWRGRGIVAGMPYARFQSAVPLCRHEHLAASIERMRDGAADVLWPGPCTQFVQTAGASTGQPRQLPMTAALLAHYRQAALAALLYYTARVGHTGAFRGRQLIIGAATSRPSELANASPPRTGDLSRTLARALPAWAVQHLYEPGITIDKIADDAARLAALVTRATQRDLALLAGTPAALLEFAQALHPPPAAEPFSQFKPLRPPPDLLTTWPNLECCVHTGMILAPLAEELREKMGATVNFHEVYGVAEGFIAAEAPPDGAHGLRLMADLGLFFEFLPLAEFDVLRWEHLGPKAVPLSEVTVGIDYALVLTTPGGLARLVIDDIVRFTSKEPARLIYRGKTTLRLNRFAENLMEQDLTAALVTVCARHRWRIVNFHVAPLTTIRRLTAPPGGRHEWWLELQPGTEETPIGSLIAAELDAELQANYPDYATQRNAGVLESALVRLVAPGVFAHCLRHGGRGGHATLPRCRSDRVIADELAQITHFAPD